MPKIRLLIAATAAIALASSPAMAAKNPRHLGTDNRITQVPYSPNEVYELTGTYGYQTTVEFEQGETIKIASIGDSIAWQVVPLGNRLFLKPVEKNATTNLTVVTDKRAYYFRLRANSSGAPIYLLRFRYGGDVPFQSSGLQSSENVRITSLDSGVGIDKYNLDYEIAGDKVIGLKRVFDDGQFTYFEFEPSVDVPAIFLVDGEKKEATANVRREGKYIVVEKVHPQYTLRLGRTVACIFNRNLKHPAPDMTNGHERLNNGYDRTQ